MTLHPFSVFKQRKPIPVLLLWVFATAISCKQAQENHSAGSAADSASNEVIQTENKAAADSNTIEDNTMRLVRLTLLDLHKEDINKALIDSFSRQFKFSQADLNDDGNKEILVGLTGPFFCGSGGCTVYLLTHHGDVLTKFSVVGYPVYVDSVSTKGWKNLIMYSGGTHRLVKWNGQSYPTNPSTLPVVKQIPATATLRLLDWENQPTYVF